MRIGFTGTQRGMTDKQRLALRQTLRYLNQHGGWRPHEFHHGDCIGSDAQAHDVAADLNYDIFLHPPINESKRAFKSDNIRLEYPAKHYLERNHDIVEMTQLLIATPNSKTEMIRSGTWATIRYARRLERECILIIRPDGGLVDDDCHRASLETYLH